MTLAVDRALPQRGTPIPRFDPRSRALAVLAELHRRANENGGSCTTTIADIAETLGVASRTVQRAITRLSAIGRVEVTRPGGEGWRGVPNMYRPLPCPHCDAPTTAADDGLCHHVRPDSNGEPTSGDQS